MQDLEKRYSYSNHNTKKELRRQMLGTAAILVLVLGLAVVCAITYYHARGGFSR